MYPYPPRGGAHLLEGRDSDRYNLNRLVRVLSVHNTYWNHSEQKRGSHSVDFAPQFQERTFRAINPYRRVTNPIAVVEEATI